MEDIIRRGKSQKISDAFEKFIEGHGGKVMTGSRVEKILNKRKHSLWCCN